MIKHYKQLKNKIKKIKQTNKKILKINVDKKTTFTVYQNKNAYNILIFLNKQY